MEMNEQFQSPSELEDLLKAKEKYYYEAIKNNVKFDKLKTIQESIKELKLLISKKKRKEEFK
jgi:hypothetical protein